MSSGCRSALRWLPRSGAAALLSLCLCPFPGCRDNGTGPGSQAMQTVAGLVFAPGDTLIFDGWDLDPYNYAVGTSHSTPLWKVLTVGDSYAGQGSVTSILESPPPGASSPKTDTLRFRFLPSGDIYEFGFIAGVVERREGTRLAAGWDRVAAFSLPTNGTWTVGAVDSAGSDTLRGTVVGDQGYFIATLNGVRTVFHGYEVSLVSLDIDYTLVVSDLPPAVLVIQELSTPVANGYLRTLASLTKH
jgi:hypothetical protein